MDAWGHSPWVGIPVISHLTCGLVWCRRDLNDNVVVFLRMVLFIPCFSCHILMLMKLKLAFGEEATWNCGILFNNVICTLKHMYSYVKHSLNQIKSNHELFRQQINLDLIWFDLDYVSHMNTYVSKYISHSWKAYHKVMWYWDAYQMMHTRCYIMWYATNND